MAVSNVLGSLACCCAVACNTGSRVVASAGMGSSGDAPTSTTEPSDDTLATTLVPGTSSGDAGTTAETSTGSSGSTGRADFGELADDPLCLECCGNGMVDRGEQCDCGQDFCTPEQVGFRECFGQTVVLPDGQVRQHTGGILNCSPASCMFDYAQCSFCGDLNLDELETCELNLPTPTCQELGLGDASEPLPCGDFCQLDTSSC